MQKIAMTFALMVLVSVPMLGAVKTEVWGKTSAGQRVALFTLEDSRLRVQITEYGARIVTLEAPDRHGRKANIVLGYSKLAQYVVDPKDYFGEVVGRYGNRLAKGTFSLSGKTYHVPVNNKGNALHGGPEGFSSKVWKGRIVGANKVEFTLVSSDGDMGFPGAMTVHVLYALDANRLRIDYEATTTKSTVVNLTNHSYFNLAGENSGDILEQEVRINADSITPVDASLIPTGAMSDVGGTPFDFRERTKIGKRITAKNEQLERTGGYDQNFILNGPSGMLREAVYAVDPASGRTLTVMTTEPGVQFYSGNFLNGSAIGYSGRAYKQHAGFCLETQHFPDSPNHANFPTTMLKAGRKLHSETLLVFGVSQSMDMSSKQF